MCPTDDRTSPSEARRAEGAEVDRVLVPIEVLEADAPPGETPAFVRGMEVVLLGYHYVPLQSIPAQFREKHEDQARRRLGELADAYREAGATVEERLAFVHDPERAIARAADQDSCGALLLARPTDAMEQILAPVAGEAHLPRVLDLVASVMEAGAEVTLVRVVEDEDRLDEAELLLEGAEEKLVERGIDEERVVTEALASDDRLASIAEEAERFDGLVLGEFERSLREVVFGEVHKRVARSYGGPILLVRRAVEAEGPDVPRDL